MSSCVAHRMIIPIGLALGCALSGTAERLQHPASWIAEAIGQKLKLDSRPSGPEWGRVLEWLAEVDQQLVQQDRRLLFCIDEAERLQEAIEAGDTDTGTIDLMRQSADQLQRIRFLMSAARPLDLLGQVWLDRLINARQIEIDLWDRATCLDFIRHPIPDFPDIYPEGSIDYIAEQTAGHPF